MSKVTIKFSDENPALAFAIGAGLIEYARAHDAVPAQGPALVMPDPVVEEAEDETPELDVSEEMPKEPEPEPVIPEPPVAVDKFGVEFDEIYCSKSVEPFYGSGVRVGQWKKKRGVAAERYDAWYAIQRDPEPLPEAAIQAPVETAAAFGGSAPAAPAPADAGALMLWVSEQQAAGNIQQADIEAAYAALGIQVTELFNGTGESIADNVAALYAELNK